MAASGVTVQEDVISTFTDMKLNKTKRYLILRFKENNTQIGIDKQGDRESTFDNFLADLQNGHGGYAVYDHEYMTADNRKQAKLVFIIYAPDDLPVKEKLLTASSSEGLVKKLEGVVKWQVNDPNDLEVDEMTSICLRN